MVLVERLFESVVVASSVGKVSWGTSLPVSCSNTTGDEMIAPFTITEELLGIISFVDAPVAQTLPRNVTYAFADVSKHTPHEV
jgi:hypothetical protein